MHQACILIIGFIILVIFITISRRYVFGGWVSQHKGELSEKKCGLSAMLPIICYFREIAIEHISNLYEKKTPISSNIKISPDVVEYMYRYLKDDNCKKILDTTNRYELHNLCDIRILFSVYQIGPHKDSPYFNDISFLRAMLNIEGDFSDIRGNQKLEGIYSFKMAYVNPKQGISELCYTRVWGDDGTPYGVTDFSGAISWIVDLCTSSRKKDDYIPIIKAFTIRNRNHIMCMVYNESSKNWVWYNDDVKEVPPMVIPVFHRTFLFYEFVKMRVNDFGIFIKSSDYDFIKIGPKVSLSKYKIPWFEVKDDPVQARVSTLNKMKTPDIRKMCTELIPENADLSRKQCIDYLLGDGQQISIPYEVASKFHPF